MTDVLAKAQAFLRNYVVDGVPASGANKPAKADGLSLFTEISNILDALTIGQSNGTLVYSTRAALYGNLVPDAHSKAEVWADSTPAYNGVYEKVGATTTGSWTKISDLAVTSLGARLTVVEADLDALTEQLGDIDGLETRTDGAVTIEDSTGLAQFAVLPDLGVFVPGGRFAYANGPYSVLDERMLGSFYIDDDGIHGVFPDLVVTRGTASLAWTNAPSQDGFGIAFDIEGGSPQTVASLDISTDEHFTNLIRNEPLVVRAVGKSAIDYYHSVVQRITGLEPGTQYYVAQVVDGVRGATLKVSTLAAAGVGSAFPFLFGSCSEYTADPEYPVVVMTAMAEEPDVAFALHLGDIAYADIDVIDVYLSRRRLSRAFRANLDTGVALRAFAWFRAFDDHDNGDNDNSTETPNQLAISINTRKEFRETFAGLTPVQVTLGETDPDKILPVYTWDAGKARFVQLDTRSQRTPSGSPPTMLGNGSLPTGGWNQLGWFLDTFLPQAAADALAGEINHLYIITPTGWTGEEDIYESWPAWAAERTLICDKLVSLAIDLPNMTILTGDYHSGGADDGFNADYSTGFGLGRKLKLLMSSPFRRDSKTGGGPLTFDDEDAHLLSAQMYARVDHRANGTWLATFNGVPNDSMTGAVEQLGQYDSATITDPTDTALGLYLAALSGTPTTEIKAAYRAFISSLYHYGTFDELDALWLMANIDSQAARINLINPGTNTLSVFDAPAFTALQGYQGDGTNDYLGTGINPTVGTHKFTQDQASMFVWCRNNTASDSADMGNGKARIVARRLTSNSIGYRSNTSATETQTGQTTSVGLSGWARTASNHAEVYRNGVSVQTITTASEALDNNEIRILGASGTPSPSSARQIAFAGLGGGLTDAMFAGLYIAGQRFLTAIGAA